MNRKGELSNKPPLIVAIDYDTIFSRKPHLKEYFTKSPLERAFRWEFRELTRKLFYKGFTVYIICAKALGKTASELDDIYFGRYLFYANFLQYSDLKILAEDCRYVFNYFICETPKGAFLDNVYSLDSFKELL